MSDGKRVEESSGNVFADLALRDPQEALAKAELAGRIVDLIDARGLTQHETATLLGTDQAKVSALVRGNLKGFSVERLIRYLTRLGDDVVITVRPQKRRGVRTGRLTVVAGIESDVKNERRPLTRR